MLPTCWSGINSSKGKYTKENKTTTKGIVPIREGGFSSNEERCMGWGREKLKKNVDQHFQGGTENLIKNFIVAYHERPEWKEIM